MVVMFNGRVTDGDRCTLQRLRRCNIVYNDKLDSVVIPNREMCPITLILFMSSSVDPPSWWCIPKTSPIITNVFNNTHELNLCILITSLNKTCVLVSHQLYICVSKTSRNDSSKRCSKTSRNCKKKMRNCKKKMSIQT